MDSPDKTTNVYYDNPGLNHPSTQIMTPKQSQLGKIEVYSLLDEYFPASY